MGKVSSGFVDKLYWRKARGQWHCFKKLAETRGYISLCQRVEINFLHGQKICRPDALIRCGVCDGAEMERRGWEYSGQASPRHRLKP